MTTPTPPLPRRDFLKKTSLLAGSSLVAAPWVARAATPGKKLGLAWVGLGHRGRLDLQIMFETDPNVTLLAVADPFPDMIEANLGKLRAQFPDRVKVTPGTTFGGLDGYRKILAMPEVDLVVLSTPPGFRPVQFRACIEAGKHVFMEKPGAVDPVGVRSLHATSALAAQKGLTVGVGLQQRFMEQYQEVIRRVQDGAIGEIRQVGAYWIGTMMKWHWQPRQPAWSDLEHQIRTWPYYTWLSGDCCVEQLVHNIDVNQWLLGANPESCRGLGGRIVRTGPEFGHIYDHFSFDFDYPGGLKAIALNAQIEGVSDKVNNTISGTHGDAWVSRSGGEIRGANPWKFTGDTNGDPPMYRAVFASVRGETAPLNMGATLADSTMVAIMGRISTYTGRLISWDWLNRGSKLDLTPPHLDFGQPLPVDPVPLPGQTLPI